MQVTLHCNSPLCIKELQASLLLTSYRHLSKFDLALQVQSNPPLFELVSYTLHLNQA